MPQSKTEDTLTASGPLGAAPSRPAGPRSAALPGSTRPGCSPTRTHTVRVTGASEKAAPEDNQRLKVTTHPAKESLHTQVERHPREPGTVEEFAWHG